MAKKITKKEVEKEEVSHAGPVNEVVAEAKATKEEKKEVKLPATSIATEKFYALEVEGGAVIINPNGVRVSKLMTLDKARQDAQRMNK